MRELTTDHLEPYLQSLFGEPVKIVGLARMGDALTAKTVKGYGYGVPIQIDYERGGKRRRAVLETMSPGPFGHEDMADRAQVMLWSHPAFNRLPGHVRSLDVGAFRIDGNLLSLGDADECFILMEYVEGEGYFKDLARIRDLGAFSELDLERADALCDYLAEIHRKEGPEPGRYTRRIRELIGHGECIMGLIDSYPSHHGFIKSELLASIEQQCVAWRWRLKERRHRLRQVHGDFHPWNILFRSGTDFTVLDRSRGEWGDPADDLSCLTMNYLFFSLQRTERLEGDFDRLFQRFWRRYLEKSGDSEILEVLAPFFAFRGLVMASPVWYPSLAEGVRRKLFTFMQSVLASESFDPERVNDYCGS